MPQSKPFPDRAPDPSWRPQGSQRSAMTTDPRQRPPGTPESSAVSTQIRHTHSSTRATPSKSSRVYSAHHPTRPSAQSRPHGPRDQSRSTLVPAPQPRLLPPTQSRDMSLGSPAGRLRQVWLSGHWAGAWPGLPPALGSRGGPASAAGHLGSALGPRTAPDVVLTCGRRVEPRDA